MSAFMQKKVFRRIKLVGSQRRSNKRVTATYDIGTAFTGAAVAVASSDADSEINISCGAPSAKVLQEKEPTVLLRDPNDKEEEWSFGNRALRKYHEAPKDVQKDMQLYKNFKMTLKTIDGRSCVRARAENGQECSVLVLMVKCMEFLKEYVFKTLRESYGLNMFNMKTDIQWVITVPAIWSFEAKKFMRHAAFMAGLIQEETSDDLVLALEPEAAAVGMQVEMSFLGLLSAGVKFCVVDLGGGTVDVTVHLVEQSNPVQMKTIWSPEGSACGGNYVNANFLAFLRELLSLTQEEEYNQTTDLNEINKTFEDIKINYKKGDTPDPINVINIIRETDNLTALAEDYNRKHPATPIVIGVGLRRGSITLSPELMFSFFLPLMEEAVRVTRSVLAQVKDVSFMVMVGGFGASEVVYDYFKTVFQSESLDVIKPSTRPTPQAAVVWGAVYYGLYRQLITHRLSPYTYGVWTHPDIFKVLVRKGEELPVDYKAEINGTPVTDEQTQCCWRLMQSSEQNPAQASSERSLGCVFAACPPAPTKEERRQYATFWFGGAEVLATVKNAEGEDFAAPISLIVGDSKA